MTNVTKLPLEIDKLQDFITCDNKDLNIDYNESKPLKTVGFLSYISNLNIVASVDLGEVDEAELEEMVTYYLTTKQLVVVKDLNLLTAALILNVMGIDYSEAYELTVSDEFIKGYCERNSELLMNYYVFISSLVGYSRKILDDLVKEEHDVSEYAGIITDIDWVGTNVVNLFEIDSFLELFFSSTELDYSQFYFTVQFEEYVFNGTNLYKYFVENLDNKQWLIYITSQMPEYKDRIEELHKNGCIETNTGN